MSSWREGWTPFTGTKAMIKVDVLLVVMWLYKETRETTNMRICWNRQTSQNESLVGVRSCEFKSLYPHQFHLGKENTIMTNAQKIAAIDSRIALLQSRAGKENGRIIKKLLRKRRTLAAN